jgi:phytoene synthase
MVDAIDPADLAACRTLLAGGSRSFHAASRLLPRTVMAPATALYAFCRVADDLIDAPGGAAALPALHRRLDRIFAGLPDAHPADRALSAVVGHYRMPRALLDGLLEGFAWDAAGRRYETLADLQAYAARVAGTVGAMMAVLMGARAADVVARACDLGVAMQLSNIARDVGEDARAGRLYLPLEWLREAGIDPVGFMARPAFSPALGGVVRRLVDEADALYARADAGIAALPLACRPGIGAARRLYAGIGHRVAARGGNSVDGRAVVPGSRKLLALGRATLLAVVPGGSIAAPALPAVRHLVMAVANAPAPRPAPNRLIWLLELFAELDSRQTMASTGRSVP